MAYFNILKTLMIILLILQESHSKGNKSLGEEGSQEAVQEEHDDGLSQEEIIKNSLAKKILSVGGSTQLQNFAEVENLEELDKTTNRFFNTDNTVPTLQPIDAVKNNIKMNILKRQGEYSKNSEDVDHPSVLTPDRIIGVMMYGFLVITGAYVALFGFRIFRLLMVVLGFYVSYYLILFFLTEFKLFDAKNVGHQLGLFFGCIILGFIIAIACYLLEKVNFVIFGTAIGTVIALFYAQFFVNFGNVESRKELLYVYIGSSSVFSAGAFFFLDQALIWGSALIGSIITTINLGVITNQIDSFEERETFPDDIMSELKYFLIFALVLFLVGVSSQYYLRKQIIREFNDKNIDEIQDASFVN